MKVVYKNVIGGVFFTVVFKKIATMLYGSFSSAHVNLSLSNRYVNLDHHHVKNVALSSIILKSNLRHSHTDIHTPSVVIGTIMGNTPSYEQHCAITTWSELHNVSTLVLGNVHKDHIDIYTGRDTHFHEIKEHTTLRPYASDVFEHLHEAHGDWKVYANADILFDSYITRILEDLGDIIGSSCFIGTGRRYQSDPSLVIGATKNCTTFITHEDANFLKSRSILYQDNAQDYFFFRNFPSHITWREVMGELLIGTVAWDNYLNSWIATNKEGCIACDMTSVLYAFHMEHGREKASHGTLAAKHNIGVYNRQNRGKPVKSVVSDQPFYLQQDDSISLCSKRKNRCASNREEFHKINL